jgi:hypothetical protein
VEIRSVAAIFFQGWARALVLVGIMHSDSRHPPSIIQLTSTADSDPDPSRWLESWDVLSTWVPTYPTHIAVEEDGTVRMNGKRIG